eukprot:1301052-Rhodomonas_salina.1
MKIKLTDQEVLEIFAQRKHLRVHHSNPETSKQLAVRYRVSERTVRDIWSRRTRRDLTKKAWTVEEHSSQTQAKQGRGRPFGAKDGVPRQRALHNAPSNSSESSNSDTTSEDSASRDSLSITGTEPCGGQAVPQEMPPKNGLLFNQAILELLRKGIQQPPPNAPGAAPTPLSSELRPVQQTFPIFFDALHPPAVPPFTSSQQVQTSLFNGWHTLGQAPSTMPPGQLLEILKSNVIPSVAGHSPAALLQFRSQH